MGWRTFRFSQSLPQLLEGRRVGVVAVDVLESLGQACEGLLVYPAAVFLDTGPRPLEQLLTRPARLGHADDRDIERSALHHALQCWKNLLVGEVSRRPEKDQGVRAARTARLIRQHTLAVYCAADVVLRAVRHKGLAQVTVAALCRELEHRRVA